MLVQQHIAPTSEWQTGIQVWNIFAERRPELGLRPGKWAFHNFLRVHRQPLRRADAIRLVRNRFWLAHVERFCAVAFECATGQLGEGDALCSLPVRPVLPGSAGPAFDKPRRIVHQGLSPYECLRVHGQLPGPLLEQVLEQNARLLLAVDAFIDAWPELAAATPAANDPDYEPVLRIRAALQGHSEGQH